MAIERDKQMDRNLKKALALVRAVIKDPAAFPDRFIAIPMDPAILTRIFTPEKMRLLKAIQDEGEFSSVNAVAKKLRRHQSRVSRDIAELSAAGLISIERNGATKRVRAPKRPVLLTP